MNRPVPKANSMEPATGKIIYKIVTAEQWSDAERLGEFRGAPIDLQDGYIHFSDSNQLRQTAEKHFAGQLGLLLVAVDSERLGPELKWEPSRGGDLFPHLYRILSLDEVDSVVDLPCGKSGQFLFPEGLGD